MFHRPQRADLAALGGAGVLAALTAGLVLIGPRTPPAYTQRIDPASIGRTDPQPVVLVIGDDVVAPTDDVPAEQTFAARACADLRWICNVDAQPGTGYVAGSAAGDATQSAYGSRVGADRAQYLADTVVVVGGLHDVGVTGDPGLAARRLFLDLRRAYPKARVAVVEPFWTGTGPAPRTVVRERTAVQDAADKLPGWSVATPATPSPRCPVIRSSTLRPRSASSALRWSDPAP